MAKIRIGISGWRYTPWRGTFYPKDLKQADELRYAAEHFRTIEINGSFYSLQRPSSYSLWYRETPQHFVFAVKGGRYLTHMRKLRDVEAPLANFFAQGVFNLREKLGPILWQFPPNFRYDHDRMARFFELLPHDLKQAQALARRHDRKIRKERTQLAIDRNRRLRHAVEIRHESFCDPRFIELLQAHDMAFVVAETARKWPMVLEVTADFVYMRLHGDKELYRSGYSDKALDRWAKRIRAWNRAGLDVYCYFDNTDVKLRAPFDAQSLMKKLKL
jgi:uncharacterized protein YecE (DUF72 family)